MGEHIDISMLVCTYNRCDDLAELLASALHQDHGELSYEIVVVDNNSSDRTRAVVEELIRAGHSRVSYLFEGRQGKGYALNTGLAALRGEFYAILDDDLILPPTFLAETIRAFRRHPEVSCLGGKVLPRWKGTPPGWLTPRHWSALALADYGDSEIVTGPERPLCLLAGVFRTADVTSIGGYDCALAVSGNRIGGTEDADLFDRLYAGGKRGLYTPGISLWHKVEPYRLTREYHRRWHAGHGRHFAMMRDPAIEKSRFRLLGIPGHLLREALKDAARWIGSIGTGRRESAFEAELRLRFFAGYAGTRLGQRSSGESAAISRPS